MTDKDNKDPRIEMDFPGGVYNDSPRLSFYGRDGKLIKCRTATDQEWITLSSPKIIKK